MCNRVLGIVGLCALAVTMVWGQSGPSEKPVLYTYVSHWSIPRAMWGDYQKMEAADDELMGKAVAEGTLVGFGSFSVLNHQEGAPTHGSWFQARSMANLMKALEMLRAAPDATSQPLAASKHWDFVMMSHEYGAHSGTFKNGYLRRARWNYRQGASDPGGKILKATMVAGFEKLLDEGALHSYQIAEESVHSADPGALTLVIITNGAEGLDKFDAMIEDMEKNNPAGESAFGSLFDEHGHRDMLAHVDLMTQK